MNEQGGSKCDADGKCCGNKVKADRFYADLSEGFAVSDGHTSADEGAEDKRYDKHLHQADKALSDDIQHTFYDDGVLDIAGLGGQQLPVDEGDAAVEDIADDQHRPAGQ